MLCFISLSPVSLASGENCDGLASTSKVIYLFFRWVEVLRLLSKDDGSNWKRGEFGFVFVTGESALLYLLFDGEWFLEFVGLDVSWEPIISLIVSFISDDY